MTFIEHARRILSVRGYVVDHFHAFKGDEETIIFRATSSEGYTRYLTVDGYAPEPEEFDKWEAHRFHGHTHEPLWQKAAQPAQAFIEKENWFVRFMKRLVSW